MKKLILFLILLAGCFVVLQADNTYDIGETYYIRFGMPDSIDGEPVTPDSIRYRLVKGNGTPSIRTGTLSNWNSETGKYSASFTLPNDADSADGYGIWIDIYAQTKHYTFEYDGFILHDLIDGAALIDSLNIIIAQKDSIIDSLATYMATLSKPGDAMTLTPAERAAIEDTMALHAATYKADVSNLDESISSARAAMMTALRDTVAQIMSDTGLTSARAGKLDSLDYLDALISGITSGSIDYDSLYTLVLVALGDSIRIQVYAEVIQALVDSTTRYQGAASGLTAPEVASSVADSIGRRIGAGDYACSLYVLNTTDSTAIQNVSITTYSNDGGTLYTQADTDVNGLRLFWFDAEDSIIFYCVKPGCTFTMPEYISINTVETDTIWGTVLSPSPATGDMIALQFYQLTPGYDTLSATYVKYKLVKDSIGTGYSSTDRLTFGTGTSTIALTKSEKTVYASSSDSSYINFDAFSSYDIYVNGVADSSSYYQFIIGWLDGEETTIIMQLNKTSPQNPSAP